MTNEHCIRKLGMGSLGNLRTRCCGDTDVGLLESYTWIKHGVPPADPGSVTLSQTTVAM